jgi:type II secretory pathway pseudopilin PulG
MLLKTIQNNKGQSLIELVVAISIILIGVVSTLVLTVATIRGGKASEMQTIASNLAREGIEVIKQHRYNNWLKIESNAISFQEWDEGLYNPVYSNYLTVDFNPVTPATWNLDFNIEATTVQNCLDNGNCRLYLNNGIYSHNQTGTATPFYRIITINPICLGVSGDEKIVKNSYQCAVNEEKIGVQVISDVRWRERGSWASVMLEDHLYNWK